MLGKQQAQAKVLELEAKLQMMESERVAEVRGGRGTREGWGLVCLCAVGWD